MKERKTDMKKRLCIVLIALIALLAVLPACRNAKDSPSGEKKVVKTYTVNGVEVALDTPAEYGSLMRCLTSSAFRTQYSSLSGQMYYLPGEGVSTAYSLDNVYLIALTTTTTSPERTKALMDSDLATFSEVISEEREYNGSVWSFFSFLKNVTDPDTGEQRQVRFHQYYLQKDFFGAPEWAEVNVMFADDSEAFEDAFLQSLEFLK